jgi:Sulfotransferase domain
MADEITDLGSPVKEAEGEGLPPHGEGAPSVERDEEAAGAGRGRDVIPQDYTPITEFLPDDIFIIGYPRSGHTWFQVLVTGVVYGVDPRFGPLDLVNHLVPDVHFSKYFRRYTPSMCFKSHDLPRPDYRKVVYLLRDGRDVMVSYRHYQEAIAGTVFDFLAFVSPETPLYPCHWAQHVDAWLQNPHNAQMLVIKYEDLLGDPVNELKRFCEFADVSREPGYVAAIVEAASFRNLHGIEARTGFGWPVPQFPRDKFFFRRGEAGSYKDEMPPEVLQRFLEHSGDTLRRCGYITEETDEEQKTVG